MPKLTCAYLKSVQPKPGRSTKIIPDGTVGGLSVRIGARGAVEFSLCYRFKGEGMQQRRTLGYFWDSDRGPPPSDRYLSLEQARVLAITLKEKARAGADLGLAYQWIATAPAAGPPEKPSDATEAIIDRYSREHLSGLKTGTEFDKLIRRSCAAFLDKSIGAVTRADVRVILDGHTAAGNMFMANRVHAVLGAFLKWAVGQDLIPTSPMVGMPRPMKKEASRDRVLSDVELVAVWNAVDTLTPARRDCIRFLALTGLRRSEATEIRWVDIDGDVLTIPDPKNSMAHLVPLSPQARAIIDAQPRLGLTVFDFGGKLADLSTYVAKLAKTMSIGQWQLHDFRRTMASGMQRLGVEPVVIDKCLGHSNVVKGVAAVYMRSAYMPERTAAMKLWGEHVAKVVADNVVTLRTS